MIMKKFHQPERKFKRRRGQAIIEFALLIPVLLGVLLGIMESGWMTKNYLLMSNATREGARVAAVGSTATTTQTRVSNGAKPFTVTNSSTYIVLTYSANEGASYVSWPADLAASGSFPNRNGVPSGSLIKVTTTARNTALTGFFGVIFSRDMTVSAVMRREP